MCTVHTACTTLHSTMAHISSVTPPPGSSPPPHTHTFFGNLGQFLQCGGCHIMTHVLSHVGHVRSKPDCLFWARPLWFVTFFRVSVETHMIARDVLVTGQPNGVIMKHSTRKSRLFEPIILPRQSETSSHCVKEGSADISRSTWRPFCSKHGHVTRTSCDLLPAKS